MAIALTSMLTGAFLLAIAPLNVSELIRYIPYPLIGGFLASMSVLLVQGAFKLLLNTSITFSTLGVFIQPDEVLKWLPSLGFAILLLGLLQRIQHVSVLPIRNSPKK